MFLNLEVILLTWINCNVVIPLCPAKLYFIVYKLRKWRIFLLLYDYIYIKNKLLLLSVNIWFKFYFLSKKISYTVIFIFSLRVEECRIFSLWGNFFRFPQNNKTLWEIGGYFEHKIFIFSTQIIYVMTFYSIHF